MPPINSYRLLRPPRHVVQSCLPCRDAPKSGQDLLNHFYREGNARADKLSWEARLGPARKYWFPYQHALSGYHKTALRGAFDGGVSNEGSGGGWWLQLGVQYHHHHFDWHDICEEAFGLSPQASVTECELTACYRLASAAAEVAACQLFTG